MGMKVYASTFGHTILFTILPDSESSDTLRTQLFCLSRESVSQKSAPTGPTTGNAFCTLLSRNFKIKGEVGVKSGNYLALSNWVTKLINVTTPGLGATLCEVDISYFQDNCVKKRSNILLLWILRACTVEF